MYSIDYPFVSLCSPFFSFMAYVVDISSPFFNVLKEMELLGSIVLTSVLTKQNLDSLRHEVAIKVLEWPLTFCSFSIYYSGAIKNWNSWKIPFSFWRSTEEIICFRPCLPSSWTFCKTFFLVENEADFALPPCLGYFRTFGQLEAPNNFTFILHNFFFAFSSTYVQAQRIAKNYEALARLYGSSFKKSYNSAILVFSAKISLYRVLLMKRCRSLAVDICYWLPSVPSLSVSKKCLRRLP